MFIFLLFLHFHSFSFPLPCPSFISTISSLFFGGDTKWPTRVDMSLNPNSIKSSADEINLRVFCGGWVGRWGWAWILNTHVQMRCKWAKTSNPNNSLSTLYLQYFFGAFTAECSGHKFFLVYIQPKARLYEGGKYYRVRVISLDGISSHLKNQQTAFKNYFYFNSQE